VVTDVAERAEPDTTRVRACVDGYVQGVGFRYWVRSRALELGLAGYAANLPDGRVEVVAQGPRDRCEQLVRLLGERPSAEGRPGFVDDVTHEWLEPASVPRGFETR
jgi:acylphosphatase